MLPITFNKKITIQDVADRAGVSITTVSRVMNGNYPVKKETREKVEAAIEALGFRPNLLARSLIQNRTRTIGVITPSIENLFFSEVIRSIEKTVRQEGFSTFFWDSEGDSDAELEGISSLLNRNVDGLVLIDPCTDHIKSGDYEKLSKHTPLVLINGYATGIACNYVMNDAESGTLAALRHFREQGHERIAFLRGRKSWSYDIKEAIYRSFMEEHGLPMDANSIIRIEAGNDLLTVEQARRIVQIRMQEPDPPTAILACNDWMAIGALGGAKSLGIQVPDEMSLIGFDNTIISQIAEPKLSTVDQKMTQLGQAAAERLLELVEGRDKDNKKILLETTLVIRET